MKKLALLLFGLVIFSTTTFSQEENEKEKTEESEDKKEDEDKKKEKIKPYDKVITDKAKTDEGLFNVHQVDEKYYFEIPNELLKRDMLLITRVAKLPTSNGPLQAGAKTNEMLVNWERYKDKILIKVKDYDNVANPDDPISVSVGANFYNPTLYSFDIKAFGKDSTTNVIDVTKFYSGEVKGMNGITSRMKESYKIGGLDTKRSFIDTVKSFPINIEVKQNFTYSAKEAPVYKSLETYSIQLSQSMVLLPEVPMTPRLADDRIGFFTVNQTDYSSEALKTDRLTYLKRWRLEPKDEAAYARGELVEPIKPIVYYIDPSTPEKFRSYMKAGVIDWQRSFEKAGFKNAILVKDPPTKEEDPEFDPEDSRYSVIRYVATEIQNAYGPSVADPRSGEIIESDIIWYHNVIKLFSYRYMIETGASNPVVRNINFPLEEIGKLIRFVSAHEVGHTIGIRHNMAASNAFDVEDYRNPEFMEKNGIATTIMDYARFNYIAQPEDGVKNFITKIGAYDDYIINWGYRYYPQFKTAKEEVPTLNALIAKNADDPRFKYISERNQFDPSTQTEDIGNNAMKAGDYGLKNLKYTAEHLTEWTSDQSNDYEDLEDLHNQLVGVYSLYVRHVVKYIGGVYENRKKPEQSGDVYHVTSKELQQDAVNWLHVNLFEPPLWLMDEEVLNKIEHAGFVEEINRLQSRNLSSILSEDRLNRILAYEKNSENYSVLELFSNLRTGIFEEVYNKNEISIYRRNLQRSYVDNIIELMNENKTNEIGSLARGELSELKIILKKADRRVNDEASKYHYQALFAMLDEELELD